MEPRDRIEAVLRGEVPDKIPFTCYDIFLQKSEIDRRLRELGMCYIYMGFDYMGIKTLTPNCDVRTISYLDKSTDRRYKRTEIETPKGMLTSLFEDGGFTEWMHERPFRGPGDYDALKAYIEDMRFEAVPGAIEGMRELYGRDGFVQPCVGFSPLMDLIIMWMGAEVFAYEWADNFDKITDLMDSLHRRDQRLIKALCETALPVINYCGNISPKVVGLERAEKYIFPVFKEVADIVHNAGKLLAVHFDDNSRMYADLIAESDIDIIEAFTPYPDTDMSVKQAREEWGDKILWVNFPSSKHWAPNSEIEDIVKRIIDENGRGDRLLIGITEDMPATEWKRSMMAIAEAIDKIRL